MILVSADQIDLAAQRLSEGQDLNSISDDSIQAYMEANGASYMNSDEIQIMDFSLRVIFGSIELVHPVAAWDLEDLLLASDLLYTDFEKTHKENTSTFVESAFDKYNNEELLALLEDLLSEDVDPAAKPLIFIAGTAIIDRLESLET